MGRAQKHLRPNHDVCGGKGEEGSISAEGDGKKEKCAEAMKRGKCRAYKRKPCHRAFIVSAKRKKFSRKKGREEGGGAERSYSAQDKENRGFDVLRKGKKSVTLRRWRTFGFKGK